MTDWLHRWMGLAEHVAKWSKDPSTTVGAVLVGKDHRDLAIGYNGFPPGIADTSDRLNDRPTKYRMIQHAERNVLDNARFDTRGATLVCTLFPCCECTKSIISKGITRVVVNGYPTREPWKQEAKWAREMLDEAKVEIVDLPTEGRAAG